MPNGSDRNWVRLCAAIDGFRLRFGRWPVRVRLFPDALTDIRDHILTTEGFAQVVSRIDLIPTNDAPMIAEDDSGAVYSYGQSGFPEESPDVSALQWLGNPGLRPHAGEDAGLADAINLASKPNYLGSPDVVSSAVGEYIAAVVDQRANRISFGECDQLNVKISRQLSGEDTNFTKIPGWHIEECLGRAVVEYFDLDKGYFEGECLVGIVSEGLAAVSLKLGELLKEFDDDELAEWERDAIPQIHDLHQFVTAVMLGTNELTHPAKHLNSFAWRRTVR